MLIWHRKYFKARIELDYICEFIAVFADLIRFLIMVGMREKLFKLHTECRAIWDTCSEAEHHTVLFFIKKTQKLFRVFFVICNLLTVFYSVTAFAIKLPPMEPNGTETRLLPFRFVWMNWWNRVSIFRTELDQSILWYKLEHQMVMLTIQSMLSNPICIVIKLNGKGSAVCVKCSYLQPCT